jgi:phosphoribosylglycinamide formyltransferase 1
VSGRTPVGVLVSGAGTNLEALLNACADAAFPAEVVLALSNRSSARALEIARRRGVPALALSQAEFGGDAVARDEAMRDRFRAAGVRLVVCAGYDRILANSFLDAYPDAILNVHPSLLPAFGGGMDAVEQALARGVRVTGCTVQLLERGEPDGGPIVLQAAVPVEPDDDAATLRARIHACEWELLPQAVALWCSGRIVRDGPRVRVLPAPAAATV